MNDATRRQLRLIGEIASALDGAGAAWWLFGGWAMDFHAGEVTRDHADIEIFIRRDDLDAARAALLLRGFVAPTGIYPEEAQSFLKEGQEIGLWFLVTDDEGRTVTPGRWSDWPWRAGAFEGERARIGDLRAPAMSAAGLLDMKLGFAAHPHGRPLREKDVADIEHLRAIIRSKED